MNQQGFIVEIVDDKTAKMRMQRHSACAPCGKMCKINFRKPRFNSRSR